MASEHRRDLRRLGDVLIPGVFATLSTTLVIGLVDEGADRGRALALAALHVLPLAFRRRWPLGVLGVMCATALATIPLAVPVVALGPAVLVALYTVGSAVDPSRSRAALAGTWVVMTATIVGNGMGLGTVASDGAALSVAWWLGDRARRAAADAEAERAAAHHTARRAVEAERLRIARELHDVVAHAMSVIAVQAGTGRYVIDESPEVARDALASIEQTSRSALGEMRRLLAVLRDDEGIPGDLLPTPGLGSVPDLVAVTAEAGIHVDLATVGDAVDLPSGVDLCAYRVIQEALTNVRKHARASRAVVTIAYEPAELRLEIVDDGIGAGRPASRGHDHGRVPARVHGLQGQGQGQGQVGMFERVQLYGGQLELGPAAGGGYRVAARLPLAANP